MSVNLIDALSVVVLILGWSLALSVYPRLPERVPVHFGLRGEADRWGGRWMIFMIPLVVGRDVLPRSFRELGAPDRG